MSSQSKLKWVTGAAALLATVLVGTPAHAYLNDGYACRGTYVPGSSYGTYGSITFQLYTGAHCAGTFMGNYTICSTGATYPGCGTGLLYGERALIAVHNSLADYAAYGSTLSAAFSLYGGSSMGWVTGIVFIP